MRSGVSWHDVCILNLSGRGLGIQAAEPPPRGTYVEVCRGSHVIVARVMWARGHRAGLHSQDRILVHYLIRDEPANDRDAPACRGTERRRGTRAALQRYEASRLAGRTMEFACLGLVATAFGMAVLGTVEQALAQPLAEVREAFDR